MKTNLISRTAAKLLMTAAVFTTAATGLSAITAGSALAAPNPRDVMEQVSTARKLDGSEAVVKMTILNKAGKSIEHKLSMATKLFDGGKTEKRIYKFLSGDNKGTGVLVFDYATKADDMWIFMPAGRKTVRIVSSQRSKSFMGSEFSRADLNVPALDDYTYALVKEESVGGDACYVIDVKPKNDDVAEGEGYSKKTYWVSKGTSTVRKGLFYDLDGDLLKELKTDNIKLLDSGKKRYRAMKMEMTNKKNGRRSIFETEKVSGTAKPSDDFFTTRYLER